MKQRFFLVRHHPMVGQVPIIIIINNNNYYIYILKNFNYLIYLVGGFNHLENISQWEGLSHILWTKKMFQSTNQIHTYIYIFILYQLLGKIHFFSWCYDFSTWGVETMFKYGRLTMDRNWNATHLLLESVCTGWLKKGVAWGRIMGWFVLIPS